MTDQQQQPETVEEQPAEGATPEQPEASPATSPSTEDASPEPTPTPEPLPPAATSKPRAPRARAGSEPLPSGPKMAEMVLEEAGRPVHSRIIAERVVAMDRKRPPAKRAYKGATPDQTIAAAMAVSHMKGGAFVRTAPGVFGLRHWPKSKLGKAPELPAQTRSTRTAPAPAPAAPAKPAAARKPGTSAKAKPAAKGKGAAKRPSSSKARKPAAVAAA